jgi:glycosyltransferase involved in cell wall biosynthesis
MNYQFFSIIIPSFNRAGEIKELLFSLEQLEFPRDKFEVIISDDGSSDNTAEIIQQFQQKSSYPLKYYNQKNKGPGAARNLGMEKAKGDFFIFIDSDISVPIYWLKEIAYKVNKEHADAFGGPDTYREDFSPLLKAINYSMTSFLTTGGLRGKTGKKLAKFYPRSFNMGISRGLYTEIGGFGHLRHGQDIEFSHRILKSGAKVIFIEKAYVFHIRRTNIRKFFRQVFNWGVARINLAKIDTEMLEPLHFMPALLTLILILSLVMYPFSMIFEFLFYFELLIALLFCCYAMIDSLKKYRSCKTAILLPLIISEQIFAYGLGFSYNFIRRIIFKKGEKVGFRKSYYR